MKIRITCTDSELDEVADLLGTVFEVLEVSKRYDRRSGGKLRNLYVEANLLQEKSGQTAR